MAHGLRYLYFAPHHGFPLPPGFAKVTGTPLAPGFPFPASAFLTCPHSSVIPQYRNLHLLSIGYGFRPRLSSRLTRGGLASPRKPWVHGGPVSHRSLATHASILTPGRSTGGRPPASPRTGSSPTDSTLYYPAASAPCLAPCIVGACPLDQ